MLLISILGWLHFWRGSYLGWLCYQWFWRWFWASSKRSKYTGLLADEILACRIVLQLFCFLNYRSILEVFSKVGSAKVANMYEKDDLVTGDSDFEIENSVRRVSKHEDEILAWQFVLIFFLIKSRSIAKLFQKLKVGKIRSWMRKKFWVLLRKKGYWIKLCLGNIQWHSWFCHLWGVQEEHFKGRYCGWRHGVCLYYYYYYYYYYF